MSFPRYPEYKDSGVEWLGRGPKHWEIKPFFSRFAERRESNRGMQNDNLLSLSFGRIVNKDINTLDGLLPESYETYQVVHPGDIVFRLTDLQNDKRSLRSAIVSEKGIITSAYLAVAGLGISNDFGAYLFRSYDSMKVFYSMGGGLRQSMKFEDMKRLPIPCPRHEEQAQIAHFLDHEIAKIDALIQEQQRLIKLLKEKRQAVISHAVTKGLDPTVPMKESGVEWLGEVPEHWKVGFLGYYSRIDTGATPDRSNPGYWNGDIPWVKTGEVNYELITSTEENITTDGVKNSAARVAPAGTLLMAMYGQGVTRGRVAILGIDAAYNQACAAISPLNGLDAEFLRLYMVAAYTFIRDHGNETSQMNLSSSYISKIPVTVPESIKEQTAITKYLANEMGKFTNLISEAVRSKQLLGERRSALISAAVTGKIDVRNWKPPADESAFDEQVRQAGLELAS